MTPSRRGFLIGLGALIAAPAVVRASSLMPVKLIEPAPLTLHVGPNRSFKTIQAALDYLCRLPDPALEHEVIVDPGRYGGFEVDGLSVTVIGDGPSTVICASAETPCVTARNYAAVELRDVALEARRPSPYALISA